MTRTAILISIILLAASPLRAGNPQKPERDGRSGRADRAEKRQAAASPEAGTKEPGALLRFDDACHDFGDVARKGGDLRWSFAFRNDGDRPLVVTRAFTTCSCLKVRHPRRPVAPGATDTIRVVYEPHKAEAGVFRRTVRIYSNSAAGCAELVVEGNSLDDAGAAGGTKKMN